MKLRSRTILFCVGAIGLAGLFAAAFAPLLNTDHIRSPLGTTIVARVVPERHVTDAVTAVNFDYRGFDTLGEEFILFVAVMGAMVLLRQVEAKSEEGHDAVSPGRDVPLGDAVRVWTMFMVAPTVVFGIYVVMHGQLTPGGGFQGGVVLAFVPFLIYAAENIAVFQRITSFALLEIAEAAGAAGYALIGMLGLAAGHAYMTNVLPLGEVGSVTSGGIIPCISAATGLEVMGGFVLLSYAFLQETMGNR